MAQNAIPVSQIVTINPAVVGAGGNPLSLNSIFLSQNDRVPGSSLLQFSSRDAVADYFGSDAVETRLAGRYFGGFDNSSKKPGTLFFAQYARLGATKGWMRGQSLAGMTLAQLKAVTGALSITVNDDEYQAAAINLSSVTDFAGAATALNLALDLEPAEGIVTWDALHSQFVVTSATTGADSHVSFGVGTAADALGLSSGVRTDGLDQDTPASAMDRIKTQSQNWAAYTSVENLSAELWEGFAAWNTTQNKRYALIAWDNAAGYLTPNNPAVFGSIVATKKYEGVAVVYNTPDIAAFVCGFIASINWQELNGRATAAFKSQSGLPVSVDTLPNATAVLSNNASYYGLYEAPGSGNTYNILYDGRLGGSEFRWLDPYINQIYLNAQLQLSIFLGLKAARSAPYNSQGETLIRAWAADPIAEALNNGTIRVGVPLSESQKAQIAMDAGLDISNELYGQGYYLQILPATAQVRAGRQSPPIKLWYMDGGSIQQISLASIAVL